jgi:hypothetical protein
MEEIQFSEEGILEQIKHLYVYPEIISYEMLIKTMEE